MTVGELGERMSSDELTHWIAFAKIDAQRTTDAAKANSKGQHRKNDED
jgi:hypothetical protein